TTNMALFLDGAIAYSSVLPVGGRNITNDIAIGLRVSLEDAEKIKLFISHQQGLIAQALSYEDKSAKQIREDSAKDDMLDISDLRIAELKAISRKFVVDGVIRPRLREIFELVAMEIKKSGYAGLLPAGV